MSQSQPETTRSPQSAASSGTASIASPAPAVARRRTLTTVMPPWLMVLLGICSAEMGAAVAKNLFAVTGPSGVVFLRTGLAAVLLSLLRRPRLRGYKRSDYAVLLLYGVCLSAMMLTFYSAINRIPLGIAVAISFVGPLGVAVAGSRRLSDLFWIALAAGGILLLSPLTDTQLDLVGLGFSILSASTWALFIVVSGRVARIFPATDGLTLGMAIGALFAAPFGLVGALNVLASAQLIVLSIFIAVLSSAVPFVLEYFALRDMRPATFGLLASIEPVVATLIGFVALHEALGIRELLGIVMVTTAAAATALKSAPHVASDTPDTSGTEPG